MIKDRRAFRLALMMLLPFVILQAKASSRKMEKRVDAYLKPLLDEDVISGSVLIAKDGEILLAKGYGPANREYDLPCTAETKYRLASVSKQFTAAAVMMLQEDGLLNVHDVLSTYIPDYPEGDKITIHHLLNHTSGVVNYSRLADHYRVWCMPHTVEQVIDRFKNEPLQFQPGERFEYSNSGYVLLTHIIEKVSRKPYEAFLRERIFDPLGMADTGVDAHWKIIPRRANGHYKLGFGLVQARYLDMEFTSGAGSLYSTILDLFKWDRALYGDALLSEASKEQMFTPGQGDYGYGWFIHEEFGRKVIEHRGGINGFVTQIQRFVDDRVTVITLFNFVSTFTRRVNRDLAAMALGEPIEPVLLPEGVPVDAEILAPYAGTYELQPGYNISVTVDGNTLSIAAPGSKPAPGIPQKENTFYIREENALVQFVKNPEDDAWMLVFSQSENVYRCRKKE